MSSENLKRLAKTIEAKRLEISDQLAIGEVVVIVAVGHGDYPKGEHRSLIALETNADQGYLTKILRSLANSRVAASGIPVPSPEFEGVTEGPIEFSLTVRGKGEQRAARRSSRIWREARRLARGKS